MSIFSRLFFRKIVFFIFLVLFFNFAQKVNAAVLYLKTQEKEYRLNDTFLLEVRLNTEGERINALKTEIVFPNDKLEVVAILKENSVFVFWPEEPFYLKEKGVISFAGGLPRGFEGDDLVLSVVFRVINQDPFFPSVKIFLKRIL